ncbi:f587c4b2-5b37-4028-a1a5-ad56ecb54262 [Thermothielavioides terrestris]|uniref:F587c4b2-5b37-4028-a1a5-ad56ecb54262 n=2 Tax=Thermothielavioides terrestris TaxID=2587410 RepID=A0A446BAU6_9PEZI|nr:f587c4b2-5b37-4028-a1a5-ad56ecb54262 [Thermothielavioides terrestris]
MRCTAFCLVAAWAAASAAASANIDVAGQSEFHGGVLLPRQQGRVNLQAFTGALGGAKAPAITNSGDPQRPFEVDGDTFTDFESASNRACDNQKNVCADIANNGTGSFTVGDCDQQNQQCKSAASSAATKTFPPPVLTTPDSSALISFWALENVFRKAVAANPSSASTADGEASPELPPLPAPVLPERVRGLLRTPPDSPAAAQDDGAVQYGASQWGSPYPPHLRQQSSSSRSVSSDASEDSPIHRLELQTPYLRPAPPAQVSHPEVRLPGISAAATVLANRARRLAHGITEGWIRQHTSGGTAKQEKRHWFSDGTGESENSSLSDSFSGDEAAWLGDDSAQTPKASRKRNSGRSRQTSRGGLDKQSSSETLRQSHLSNKPRTAARMLSSGNAVDSTPVDMPATAMETPRTPTLDHAARSSGSVGAQGAGPGDPLTPPRAAVKRAPTATTPRVKKKVPWKGKSVLILLPRDEERGAPGGSPMPLTESDVAGMLRSWQQLGYSIDGFDLYEPAANVGPGEESQSRRAWPDPDDMIRERNQGGWKVLLPDLDAWKRYVNELNEAKLRALGVSFGDEEPPPPSISPASATSRQASLTQYPPLPFSPPVPTSSASSNQAIAGFPFTPPFVTTATQSPGVPAGTSSGPFGVKFNPRASISIPSPHAWSPQLMLQQGHRVGSPSLANLSAVMSPASPFSPDGLPGAVGHQRHQSLQFPALAHQFQPPVRASPRLQELREVDEENMVEGPQETAREPGFVRHNASDSLQKEIDEAEYHLEEQMRSQLDNDEDYSPHNDNGKTDTRPMTSGLGHPADPLVQLAPQPPRFAGDADGIVLHHPRPHSRGHSLSQKYFTEDDASNQGAFRPTLQQISAQEAEDDEIETNPSNLGTPVQALDFSKLMHQRGYSTASNPWIDNDPGKSADTAHQASASHGSKSSFSKFNVEAPEFKFNPTSTFNPGTFAFTSNTFQPMTFSMGFNPTESSQPSLPTSASSKINVNAPVFSPGQSEFSFSTSGPKFRPDAPAFTPHSLSTSVTSPIFSGAESGSNRASSIFGNIDLSSTDIVKPAKRSKAIPIVRPESRESPAANSARDDADRRPRDVVDESRAKRARASADDDGAVPLFAEPTKEDTPVPAPRLEKTSLQEDAMPVEEKSFDESNLGIGDTTMSSTIVSETTDTKATASPSEPSPGHAPLNWAPFEFKSVVDMQAFDEARPFGTEVFKPAHKKSLSATAKAFVPGAAWAGASDNNAEVSTDEITEQQAVPFETVADEIVTPRDDSVDAAEPQSQVTAEEVVESIEKPVEQDTPVVSPAPPRLPAGTKGLAASRYARASPPPPPKRTGLAASRFANSPSPVSDDKVPSAEPVVSPLAGDGLSAASNDQHVEGDLPLEPSMAVIDEVMRRLHENPDMGVNRTYNDLPQWREPSPDRGSPEAAAPDSSPPRLPPPSYSRSDAPSPSQADYHHPASAGLEDPFTDPSRSVQSGEGAIYRLNGNEDLPASDWEGVFSEDEQTKLESRVAFFDGRVNELVGGLLAARLSPIERTLDSINHALAGLSGRAPSSRRERRSISAEIRESDADDEDDEDGPLRSMSPRRDRRIERIRAAVLDALATQRRNQPKEPSPPPAAPLADNSLVLKALEDMKAQLGQSLQPAFRSEDLKNIVEEAVERRMPPPPPAADDKNEQLNELQARVSELEERLRAEQAKVEAEVSAKRAAETRMAELDRELQSAATRIEVEMMNKSALNQRIADLEDRAQHAERQAEQEVQGRRAAEDRLSEVQRLLRISSEEETRLRELVDQKEQKIKSIESAQSKSAMRLTLLEASQANAHQAQSETQNRINALEADAREARKQAQHWQSETDRIVAIIQRRDRDLAQALDENKALHKLIDTLGTQLQENERIRDTWRSKFVSMQEEMARAAKEITEENARRTKREQTLLARQEVLEARLQAEARTRERIETELERLEMGERQGMRAVAECKRLEGVLAEMRSENHKLHQTALRYQAEFQEARESAAREVQRTRDSMQAEVENANHQVNVVREELEDQMSRLRAQLDQVKLDADTAKARHEMLLEEAQNSKQAELEELARKHHNEIEDLQARYERRLNKTTEDAQRAEQNLLERLSISASKSEHLQDKVAHLEEKLEIAKEAARAAAQAAKSVASAEAAVSHPKPAAARQLEPPEKISPQALRESIMVLQEQLQEREQRIEELEHKLSKTDPDAETKISKRDDEIIWLRELLAVRHSDLQDIISALGREDYDRNAVKDAAIRLKANLQMEEQERERAMNGGSAINLPNIAATIRDAATPRVVQAVGPLAAAWGNWRKARDLGSVLSSPAPAANGRNSTPSRVSPASSSLLGGLLTPPTSGMRQTPPSQANKQQPTAFASTGRRFTAQDLANRPRPPPSTTAAGISSTSATVSDEATKSQASAGQKTPPRRPLAGPVTPPMMRPSAYDDDAQAAEDFDDAGFFED